MIAGYVRDYLPRILLSLPGHNSPVSIEFIVDTGFDGDLSLPGSLLGHLAASFSTERIIRLADGSTLTRPYYEIQLEWDGEERIAEITVLENDPLLGAVLLGSKPYGFACNRVLRIGGRVL